jgi:hypothetical protein
MSLDNFIKWCVVNVCSNPATHTTIDKPIASLSSYQNNYCANFKGLGKESDTVSSLQTHAKVTKWE